MKINNATPQINTYKNQQQNNKNVAFSGNFMNSAKKSFTDIFALERAGNMSRKLFTLNAFAFLLSGRLVTSRDKDEIRETATRDIPTILIAVFGVPVLEKRIAEYIHKKQGFAICNENQVQKKSLMDRITNKDAKTKVEYNPASYNQLTDWYKFDEKLANGFDAFAARLKDRGGNLKKIFSSLNDEVKSGIGGFNEDNDKFMSELNNGKNSELKSKIIEAFKDSKNKAWQRAKWLKTIPTLVSFGITLSLIGIAIPKLNIFITETINKSKKTKNDGTEKAENKTSKVSEEK